MLLSFHNIDCIRNTPVTVVLRKAAAAEALNLTLTVLIAADKWAETSEGSCSLWSDLSGVFCPCEKMFCLEVI